VDAVSNEEWITVTEAIVSYILPEGSVLHEDQMQAASGLFEDGTLSFLDRDDAGRVRRSQVRDIFTTSTTAQLVLICHQQAAQLDKLFGFIDALFERVSEVEGEIERLWTRADEAEIETKKALSEGEGAYSFAHSLEYLIAENREKIDSLETDVVCLEERFDD